MPGLSVQGGVEIVGEAGGDQAEAVVSRDRKPGSGQTDAALALSEGGSEGLVE